MSQCHFGEEVLLVLKKRDEKLQTVMMSDLMKLKVEKVPIYTQMVENISIICFLLFWGKKKKVIMLNCLVFLKDQHSGTEGSGLTDGELARSTQAATVCHLHSCHKNLPRPNKPTC